MNAPIDPTTELNARLAALKDERAILCEQMRDSTSDDGGMGDRSEAQIAIARVDTQIGQLTNRIAALDTQVAEARYICEDEDGEKRTYVLVHPEMVDPANGLVSPTSPIGRALTQAAVGDSVTVRTPRGAIELLVLNIAA